MSYRRLPVILRDKMTKYYEHRFQGKLFDEERILGEISRPLRDVSVSHHLLFVPMEILSQLSEHLEKVASSSYCLESTLIRQSKGITVSMRSYLKGLQFAEKLGKSFCERSSRRVLLNRERPTSKIPKGLTYKTSINTSTHLLFVEWCCRHVTLDIGASKQPSE